MEESKIQVSTHGDHHEAHLNVDAKSKHISAGAIYNFGNNCTAQLNIVAGRPAGSFRHSGDTHALSLELDQNGAFSGVYRETRENKLEIEIEAGKAKIVKGTIPVSGKLTLQGDHHSLNLEVDDECQVSGRIKSKLTKDGSFDLSIDGGSVSGAIAHKGRNHQTKVELSPDGWKGQVSLKKGATSVDIDVRTDKELHLSSAQIKAVAKF